MQLTIKPIARIRTDFPTKFGIPRQSGVVKELKGRIVFEPEYRNEDMLRGIEGFTPVSYTDVLGECAEQMDTYGAAADPRRQHAYRSTGHPFPLPSQSPRSLLRGARRCGAAGR